MMKLRVTSALVPVVLLLSCFACSQNGPTVHKVVLNWTQSSSADVTANCVYRGAAAGTYTLPAIYCSTTPITSYTDASVTAGATYHYAVTAQAGTTEGDYSNDAAAAVPTSPAAPTSLHLGSVTAPSKN